MAPVLQSAGIPQPDVAALSSSELIIRIVVDYFLSPTFFTQLWALRPAYLPKTIPVETKYGPRLSYDPNFKCFSMSLFMSFSFKSLRLS